MKLRVSLLIFMATVCASSQAKFLEPQQALSRCQKSVPARYAPSKSGAVLSQTVKALGQDAVYLFDNGHGGFLAVSASDATDPLLGYGEIKSSSSVMPENMQGYLEMLAGQIAIIEKENIDAYNWSDSNPAITPLLQSEWDQMSPFNSQCPKIGTKRPSAGCVAVALGQIMNYYKYPDHGVGSNSYSLQVDTVKLDLSVDFENTTFMWDSILPVYKKGEYTPGQSKAVGTLLYSVGVAANMKYGVNQSGTTDNLGGRAMLNYFKYSPAITPDRLSWHTADEWNAIVYGQLSAGCPVYMAGTGSKGGHAFVCDGYDKDGFFHFNWGWKGNCNGYFKLTLLSPETSVAGNGFNNKVNIIKNIVPDKGQQPAAPVIVLMGDLKSVKESYDRKESDKIKIGDESNFTFLNYGYTSVMDLEFVLHLVSVNDTNVKKDIVIAHNDDLKPMFGYKSISFSPTLIPEGTWIASISYTVEGEPYDLIHDYDCITRLRFDATANSVTVSQQSGITDIISSNSDKAVFFDLYGRRVYEPTSGIYVKVSNGHASKIVL